MTITLPYGTWPSALDAASLFAGAPQPGDLRVDGGDLWWTESRPDDGGRVALVRWRDGSTSDVTSGEDNCRTRVHEYGGAPYAVRDGRVIAASFSDQRWSLLAQEDDGESRPVTPAGEAPASIRFADAEWLADGTGFVAVRETHGDDEPVNEIVLVPLDGDIRVLVTGRDFVAAPRLSPDGTRLAWLAWDHPFMPWDAAEVWLGTLTNGGLTDTGQLGGGDGLSACHPIWLDDERLAWSADIGGFWRPVVAGLPRGGDRPAERLLVGDLDGDVGGPSWRFGWSHLAPIMDGRLAAVVTVNATQHVVLLDVDTSDPERGRSGPIEVEALSDLVRIDTLCSWQDGVAVLGSTRAGGREVRVWSPSHGATTISHWAMDGVAALDIPEPTPMSFPTPDGAVTHAMVHLPRSSRFVGPDDELPPLLVFTHGGPTGNVMAVPHRGIAYWTSRGFAVADVNYRGSSGYGQAYRNALLGQWGVLDVIDSIAVANGLAAAGIVDRGRMAIRGGSAGGFTTLAVLTTVDHPFACGTSFYGVADLQLLAEHTHKFESRYLDRLVGPLPEAANLYRERSPLHRADRLTRPILVLQGLDDQVVPPEQSEAIVAAAAANGVPHAYLAFPGEQHGFRQLANQIRWHEAELSFYGQIMGFVPAGDLPPLVLS